MKPVFYSKIPLAYSVMLEILFAIATVITFGLAWIFYDFFVCHKYWLNRRVLLKYLKSDNLVFTKESILDNRVIEYEFKDFKVWYYTKKLELAVMNESYNDLVGLFVSSKLEDKMVIKLIRRLNQLELTN